MPATHTIAVPPPPTLYTVTRSGVDRKCAPGLYFLLLVAKSCSEHAYVLDRRGDEVYVHYLNTDKRMDEWIPEGNLRPASTESNLPNGTSAETTRRTAGTKRKRGHQSVSPSPEDDAEDGPSAGPVQEETTITISEEDYDFEQHKRITAQRNFDKVHFGEWQIKTWYEGFILVSRTS